MLKKVLCVAALLLAGSTGAYAALSGDDAIKARQACMKANGAAMGVFVPVLQGKKPYDNAAIQEALGKMDAACANWNEFWPEDSKVGKSVKTRASDAIWSDPKGFEAASATYYQAFTALKATKDGAGFKAAFPALGASCKGCHEKFRGPE